MSLKIKKELIIPELMLLLIFTGCVIEDSHTPQRVDTTKKTTSGGVGLYNNYNLEEVEFNGHLYTILTGSKKGGICHSPNCDCFILINNKENDSTKEISRD